MTRFVLASHSELAVGMKKTIEMLSGYSENISTYCLYAGQSVDDIFVNVKKELEMAPDETFLILTDIPGGSVNNKLLELVLEKNVYMVTGMNVLLVLGLILEREINEEVIKACVNSAQQSIRYFSHLDLASVEEKGDDFFD